MMELSGIYSPWYAYFNVRNTKLCKKPPHLQGHLESGDEALA